MTIDDADRQWLDAVRDGRPPGDFGHREHLLVAWLALRLYDADVRAAQADVSAAIRAIAERQGVPQRYNQTVTDAWVRIVAHCRHASGAIVFDELLATFPWLLDKRLLMRHYSSRTLASDRARVEWVEPDVQPIPA